MSAARSDETIALAAGLLSVLGPRGPSPQGCRTPPGTAHVCLFESGLVIVIPGRHCSRRSTAWTWCRRVGRAYRVRGLHRTGTNHSVFVLEACRACCGGEHCRFRTITLCQHHPRPGSRNLDSSASVPGPTSGDFVVGIERRALELVDVSRSPGELGHPLAPGGWVVWDAHGVAVVIWQIMRWMPGRREEGCWSGLEGSHLSSLSRRRHAVRQAANRPSSTNPVAHTKTRHRQRPGPTCSGRSTTRQGSCAAAS